MRPKWNAPAAVACALVVATLGACGGGGEESDAAAGAETFDLAAAQTDSDAAKDAASKEFMPAYAVLQGNQRGTVEVKAGHEPVAVAVNSKTNKIYVANKKSNNVTVIDGKTNRTTTVKVGPEPNAVRVNELTNKIYVVGLKGLLPDGSVDPNGNGSVTVIDGATNQTKKLKAGLEPYALAINHKTNKVYVANQGSNEVTVIDGKADKVTATIQLRPDDADSIYDGVLSPQDVRVNEVTNKIYISGSQSNTIASIDGKTNKFVALLTEGLPAAEGAPTAALATSQTGITPTAVAVDETRNLIYSTNFTSNDLTIIDGKTNKGSIVPLLDVQDPYTMGVNSATNKIYTANLTSKSITIIDGETKEAITIGDLPGKPHDVAINEKTNKIYFPTFILYRGAQVGDDKQVTGVILELDGATNKLTTIVAGHTPYAVAVNKVTGKVYVTNQDGGTVTVLTPAK